jgi:hypothetical protein
MQGSRAGVDLLSSGKVLLVIRLSVLLAALLLGVAAPLAAARPGTSGPKLRILSAHPVKVSGRAFQARERVRLTVKTVSARRIVRLRASRSGSFRRTVTGMGQFDPCLGPLIVTAIGSDGSRAKATLPQRECPPS